MCTGTGLVFGGGGGFLSKVGAPLTSLSGVNTNMVCAQFWSQKGFLHWGRGDVLIRVAPGSLCSPGRPYILGYRTYAEQRRVRVRTFSSTSSI